MAQIDESAEEDVAASAGENPVLPLKAMRNRCNFVAVVFSFCPARIGWPHASQLIWHRSNLQVCLHGPGIFSSRHRGVQDFVRSND